MVIARSLSPSSVTVPAGPESVMLARASAHPERTGNAKTKLALPSPWGASHKAKLSENRSRPS